MKAADYGLHTPTISAFVSTNSICQGQQVPILWPAIFATGHHIHFAHTSFKWANLASHNAGVTVAIVAISNQPDHKRRLYGLNDADEVVMKIVGNINAYLVSSSNVVVRKSTKPHSNQLPQMIRGSIPVDGGFLYLSYVERSDNSDLVSATVIRPCFGSEEFINGKLKYCLWLEDEDTQQYGCNEFIEQRLVGVAKTRQSSSKRATKAAASIPHKFFERRQNGDERLIVVPAISSENRDYLPVGVLEKGSIITGKMFGILNGPIWSLALIASRLHWVWIGTVCVRMRTDFSYSNTLGWNTFPVPKLTANNKADLTLCAENILLAREAHFPATIADLYKPDVMPDNLRAAHERNDEVLERIYIGRRFKNDTERLEKLFELYTKMTKEKHSHA